MTGSAGSISRSSMTAMTPPPGAVGQPGSLSGSSDLAELLVAEVEPQRPGSLHRLAGTAAATAVHWISASRAVHDLGSASRDAAGVAATCRPGWRRAGCDGRPAWPVESAVGHVRGRGRADAERQQPTGQGRDGEPVPCRVQDHRREGVHQPVNGGRLQPRRYPGFAIGADNFRRGVMYRNRNLLAGGAGHALVLAVAIVAEGTAMRSAATRLAAAANRHKRKPGGSYRRPSWQVSARPPGAPNQCAALRRSRKEKDHVCLA
jgi:hypothetical protein